MHGLDFLDYVVVAAFMLGMLGMGVYFARQQESTEDYFVGGRKMPWLAVGLSTLATLTSTITYLAVPGEVIKNGIGYFTQLASAPFIVLFLWFITFPFLLRLRLTSAYEYLEHRFDYRVRLLGAGLFGCIGIGWMATVVFTASDAMAQMTGWPVVWVVLGVGGIGIAYTTMGGIRADIWTDVVQAVIMFAGALFTIGFVMWSTRSGPVDWWQDASQVQHTQVPLLDLNPFTRVSTIGVALNAFAWHVCMSNASQVAMQRFFTMPSVAAARKSSLVNAIANTLLSLLLALCGIALFSYYFRQPHLLPTALDSRTGEGADRIFPHFIAHQLPPAAGGLLICALLAAAMSTIDSGVNSLSAVLTVDVFRRRGGFADEKEELARARQFTVAFGILITFLALAVGQLKANRGNSIIDILPAAFNWGVGPLGGLFFAGMFLPRCRPAAAIAATLVGSVVALVTALLKPVFGIPFSFAWVTPYGAGVTVVLAWVFSNVYPAPKTPVSWTWQQIVQEEEPGPSSAG